MVFLILLFPFFLLASDFTTIPKQQEQVETDDLKLEERFMSNSSKYEKVMETFSDCMNSADNQKEINECNNKRNESNFLIQSERAGIYKSIELKRKKDQYDATYNAFKNGEIKVQESAE